MGVGVGIVDTIHHLENELGQHVVGQECCIRDLCEDPPAKTGTHGEWVLDIATFFAPESSYYLYLSAEQVDNEDGEENISISQMSLARAVSSAIEDGIDILNISAGRSRPNCIEGNCAYCSEVRRAARNGITVIGSAGNHPNDVVHCPSNTPEAISVGGAEVECTYNMPRVPQNPTNKPPQAYWTKLWSDWDGYPDSAARGAYCTTRNCSSNGGSCDQHQNPTGWDRNPVSSGRKPDILSPVHYAAELTDGHPFVWAASSFAAPVVAGALAGILSDIAPGVSPVRAQDAIRNASVDIGAASAGLFHAGGTQDTLLEGSDVEVDD
jgi:hypothetical protein